ncbi:MAG: glycine cleavage system aminomethyltransferase GcvT [Thermodesulfobacteriota bacterium]
MKKTPLYHVHKEMGAKMMEFSGWLMPVQYEGIRAEHLAVRNSVGVFDISHMGEIEITGEDSLNFCQFITTNDVKKLKQFQAQYTFLCNESGGFIDDVILYKFSDERFLFCVNASNCEKVFHWLCKYNKDYDVNITDRSLVCSLVAIQGPDSPKLLEDVLNGVATGLKKFCFTNFKWQNSELIIARTGYTGEDGFEIFLPWDICEKFWKIVIDKGVKYGIKPCGLGCRDTLRIEMGYSLYGHEIDEETNPVEAGLLRYVKLEKGDFIGSEALRSFIDNGVSKKLIGFSMIDPGIPRHGYEIIKGQEPIGNVTSGTMSPSIGKSIGMGYVDIQHSLEDEIEIQIRKNKRKAKQHSLPFYTN